MCSCGHSGTQIPSVLCLPHLLGPPSCPCPFCLPHVTADGEREGVEGHVESQGPYLQVADIPSALFPLARAFHWPTQQDWEMCSSHVLGRKCMVATPCRPSVPLLSSPGLFWDQDLSSPLDQRATLGGPSPL